MIYTHFAIIANNAHYVDSPNICSNDKIPDDPEPLIVGYDVNILTD